MKNIIILILCIGLFPTAKGQQKLEKRPNIVIILADDMSYSDIGCFGSEIPTPNLDMLAKGGIRLTQFYNNARCCPTWASLLTGLYPHQAGVGRMAEDPEAVNANDEGVDGYRGFISKNTVTLAEVLKTAGYHTYCLLANTDQIAGWQVKWNTLSHY